ncbi:MAG: hypothetical protein IKC22_05255 [Bacilli bacterium]|nr:hypothetical protein [Bacilli bacterium]
MIKFLKDKWIFLVFVLVVTIILSVSGNINQSTSNAKYRSEISSSDETARVAKWDISTISKQNGATLDLDAGFAKTLGEETEGNWFIEIGNSSEVNAILGTDTTIRLRLDQDNFSASSVDSMGWNFISGATNPVTIEIIVYKGSVDSIVTGYKKGNAAAITKDAFNALSAADKKDYVEVISASAEKYTLLTTTAQTFTKDVESVEGKLVYFYYKDFKLSDLNTIITDEEDREEFTTIDMNDASTNLTICVNWKVASSGSSGGDASLENKKYRTYEVFAESLPTGYTSVYTTSVPKVGESGTITYYIGYKEVGFFDYQIFTSGFGGDGEPSFKFKDDVKGTVNIMYYSELLRDSDKLNAVKNYSTTPTTIEGFEQYCERLRLGVHEEFVDDNEAYQESLTYLDYGLKCAVEFKIKVEQKD